jgi:hypothetical protein
VHFFDSVIGCAPTATVGDPGNRLVFQPGLVFAMPHFDDDRVVLVHTKDLAGNAAAFPFHLSVSCTGDAATRDRLNAVVDRGGQLVLGHRAVSAQRLGTGRYEVRFDRDITGCALVATISPRDLAASSAGLTFTAGGHLSANGAYVETKNLGGGLTDFPFNVQVDCSKRPLAEEGLSVLNLNVQGTDAALGPWRERHVRLASWMGSTQTVPDVLLLQEVPASKCFAFGCDPKDYEPLFNIMTAVENQTGVQYRVALLSTGPPVEGGSLHQGLAVLYNPVRLKNASPLSTVRPQPYSSPRARTLELRESYPCEHPPEAWSWRCALIDKGLHVDRWYGPHWSVYGAVFIRFLLREHGPDASVDVYDVHAQFIPNSNGTPDLGPISDAVTEVERRFPDRGTRLFPPLMAGDFNTSEFWMLVGTTGGAGEPFDEFEIAAYPPESGRHPEDPGPDGGREVIGAILGELQHFPSRFAGRTVTSQLLPPTGPGLCGVAAVRWSDHCGQYLEIAATAP